MVGNSCHRKTFASREEAIILCHLFIFAIGNLGFVLPVVRGRPIHARLNHIHSFSKLSYFVSTLLDVRKPKIRNHKKTMKIDSPRISCQ